MENDLPIPNMANYFGQAQKMGQDETPKKKKKPDSKVKRQRTGKIEKVISRFLKNFLIQRGFCLGHYF